MTQTQVQSYVHDLSPMNGELDNVHNDKGENGCLFVALCKIIYFRTVFMSGALIQ